MNASLPPHAGRSPEEQDELAYQTYRASGDHSLRTTAELCRISEATVMSWSRREDWQERLALDGAAARERMRADAPAYLFSDGVWSISSTLVLDVDQARA